MALSSWDLLAFDTNAKPCNGIFEYKDTFIEIYKNWALITNEKMWQDGHGFIKPVLGTITYGDLHIGGVHIIAERHGEQNSIFIICTGGYNKEKEVMVGIGCYGYLDETEIYIEKLKVATEKFDWFSSSLYENGESSSVLVGLPKDIDGIMQEVKIPKEFIIPADQLYIGITETTYKAFIEFLDREVENYNLNKEYIDKIREPNDALRFNQGDRYIIKNTSKEGAPIPASTIGNSQEPILMQHLAKKEE